VLRASTVVNAAGLSAQGWRFTVRGLASQHVPGSYYARAIFSLADRSPFDRLIYRCQKLRVWACTPPG
jgi:hypothetical protein